MCGIKPIDAPQSSSGFRQSTSIHPRGLRATLSSGPAAAGAPDPARLDPAPPIGSGIPSHTSVSRTSQHQSPYGDQSGPFSGPSAMRARAIVRTALTSFALRQRVLYGRFLNCRARALDALASRVDTSTRRLRSPSTDALLPVPSTSARQGTRFWPCAPARAATSRARSASAGSMQARRQVVDDDDRVTEISAPVSALGFSAASAVDTTHTRAFWPVASAAVIMRQQ